MTHNPKLVDAFFRSYSIPIPMKEWKFHPTRKWRFDYAWDLTAFDTRNIIEVPKGVNVRVFTNLALEVEGAVWIQGRHTRGSGFVKDMEKYNEAAVLGWRIIRVQPKDLLTEQTALLIKSCICLG